MQIPVKVLHDENAELHLLIQSLHLKNDHSNIDVVVMLNRNENTVIKNKLVFSINVNCMNK